jgi:PqqD family protein of HPr-rel-A system
MWRVVPGQSLAFREWDGEAVLYNDLSGNTHLLDGGAIEVLLALRPAPLDAAALAVRLAERFGAGADELLPDIEAMLSDLAGLDLVEFLPC